MRRPRLTVAALGLAGLCSCAPAPPSESLVTPAGSLAASAQPDQRLAALGDAPPAPGPTLTAELGGLAAQARTLAKQHCGSCHGDDTHKGKPDALAVFDLKRADWFHGLDDRQLDGAIGRLEDKADERALTRFKAFVHKLRAHRKTQR